MDKLKTYIINLPNMFVQLPNGEFIVPSYNRQTVANDFNIYLIQEFSEALRMRIFPQKGALVGFQFDVFGFWKEICKSLSAEVLENQESIEYKDAIKKYEEKEAQEVRCRCIAALKKELNSEITDDGFFEISYDRKLLSNILKRFYFKGTLNEMDNSYENQREFLTLSRLTTSYSQYCAPQLSETTNPAIDLPYFWCRGKECFHNRYIIGYKPFRYPHSYKHS